jgi:hypothetical protein
MNCETISHFKFPASFLGNLRISTQTRHFSHITNHSFSASFLENPNSKVHADNRIHLNTYRKFFLHVKMPIKPKMHVAPNTGARLCEPQQRMQSAAVENPRSLPSPRCCGTQSRAPFQTPNFELPSPPSVIRPLASGFPEVPAYSSPCARGYYPLSVDCGPWTQDCGLRRNPLRLKLRRARSCQIVEGETRHPSPVTHQSS